MMKTIKIIGILLLVISLSACNPFGTSNLATPSPLPTFTPTAKVNELWSINAGAGDDQLELRFAIGYADNTLYTTDADGHVQAWDAKTGDNVWRTTIDDDVIAGVGVGAGLAVIGTDTGHVIALDAKTGDQKWDVDAGNQMLAPPQIEKDVVIIKLVDDTVVALDAASGRQLWNFVVAAPTLILRFGSVPQIADDTIYAGFASGKLMAITLQMGVIRWQQQIATPSGVNDVQQMVDIDADPVLRTERVYTATYQGRLAALNLQNGDVVWSHDISTYTGLVADDKAVYVTDAKGDVWAFDAAKGQVNWRQQKLEARVLTAPALMGDNLVVGDGEGYLHWINKQTGEFVANIAVIDGDTIMAKPLVVGDTVYALTNDGALAAYQLEK